MDPATAVGLATNIFQLIGIAHKITVAAKELRNSTNGLSREANQFRQCAEAVGQNLDRICEASENNTKDDAFRNHAIHMRSEVDRYISKLDELKLENRKSWIQSCRVALKGWWRKAELEELRKSIDRMGGQITMHIITVYVPSQIGNIYQQNVEMESKLSRKMEELFDYVKNEKISTDNITEVRNALKNWFDHQDMVKVRRKCLEALYFPQIHSREDGVKDAHRRTFRWILEPSDTGPDASKQFKFKDWLCSKDQEQNIFWISGKPGAGKSTLMKFLVHHPTLPDHLREWAGDSKLLVAECFFWRHGSSLQRSFSGLLRSLLHKLLAQCPEMIDDAFSSPYWIDGGSRYEFPLHILREALDRVLEAADRHNVKFFFMIDGLDEYDDRPEFGPIVHSERDLVAFLGRFRDNPAVKLCLSSRPLNLFREEFERDGYHICVQDLTRDDIRTYIREEFELSPVFSKDPFQDAGFGFLVDEMMEAAQGVFLWVHLVVRSLVCEVENAASISDLRRELTKLPTELDSLYSHIFNSIDKHYQKHTALVFLLTLEREGSFNIPLLYAYMDSDEHATNVMKAEKMKVDEILMVHENMIKRLNAWSRGLLEVSPCNTTIGPPTLEHLRSGCIGFSHRTVAEFLMKNTTKQTFYEQLSLDEEEFRRLRCRAANAVIKALILVIEGLCITDLQSLGYSLIDYMDLCNGISFADIISIWTDLGSILSRNTPKLKERTQTTFMDWVYQAKLSPYIGFRAPLPYYGGTVTEKLFRMYIIYLPDPAQIGRWLEQDPAFLRYTSESNCIPLFWLTCSHANEDKGVVKTLLLHGADPNQTFEDVTAWQKCLTGVYCAARYWESDSKCILIDRQFDSIQRRRGVKDTVHMFLERGADPDTSCSIMVNMRCITKSNQRITFVPIPIPGIVVSASDIIVALPVKSIIFSLCPENMCFFEDKDVEPADAILGRIAEEALSHVLQQD